MARRPKVNTTQHFLTLPLEIREQVYSEILVTMPRTLLQLIRSNRQISKEAQPFLYKQPIVFDGQAELFRWLKKVDRDLLRHVTTIEFKLHDIDAKGIVGALGERLRRVKVSPGTPGVCSNPYDTACDQQVKQIGEAFSLLPNVKDLTVLECKQSDPHPSFHMLLSFSRELGRRFPSLQTLSIRNDLLPTTFISKFRHLRALRLTGFSTSGPAETEAALSVLPHLSSLSITSPSAGLAFQQRPGYTGALRVQCITPAVLGSLRNLKYLSIYDALDSTASKPQPVFIAPDLFTPLSSLSLTTLRLATNHPMVSTPTLQAMWSFLASPSCPLLFLDLALPLVVVPSHKDMIEDELDELEEEDVGLKEVRICRPGSTFNKEKGLRGWVEGALGELGVRVEWGVWSDWFEGDW